MTASNTGQAPVLLIKGGHVIDPAQGLDAAADVLIVGDKVAQVGGSLSAPRGATVLPADGLMVTPGFIDLHCHLREPGFEDKETIATGTRAAARGGFTTVCCMGNTRPAIDSAATVEFIKKKAEAEGVVRVLPIACITVGQSGEQLVEMGELAEAGAVGFSDDGQPVMNSRLMRHALEYSLGFGLPVIDHCEDLTLSDGGVVNEGWVATRLGLQGIPAAAEESMVARDIALAQLTGARLHIAHVSTAGSAALVRRAKEMGLSVTAEVTPHHLTLTEARVLGRVPPQRGLPLDCYDTNAKVNPPLRSQADVAALVAALRDGAIDAIATDHAPHTAADKLCEFDQAAFGISGLETALAATLALVHSGHISLFTLVSRLTRDPARVLAGGRFASELGSLKPGAAADVAIFDPNAQWLVNASQFASRGKNTPLGGSALKGKVMATIFGGRVVYKDEILNTNS